MRQRDLTAQCGPLDELILLATTLGVHTTGIGDGGNEVGMGKVCRRVAAHITYGETIACATSTTYLVTAGVSNWGGYALCAALAVQHRVEGKGESEQCHALLTSVEEQSAVLHATVVAGAVDGITAQAHMSVDGLPFDPDHISVIESVADAVAPVLREG